MILCLDMSINDFNILCGGAMYWPTVPSTLVEPTVYNVYLRALYSLALLLSCTTIDYTTLSLLFNP